MVKERFRALTQACTCPPRPPGVRLRRRRPPSRRSRARRCSRRRRGRGEPARPEREAARRGAAAMSGERRRGPVLVGVRLALLVAALGAVGVFHVWSHTRVTSAGYRLGELQRRRRRCGPSGTGWRSRWRRCARRGGSRATPARVWEWLRRRQGRWWRVGGRRRRRVGWAGRAERKASPLRRRSQLYVESGPTSARSRSRSAGARRGRGRSKPDRGRAGRIRTGSEPGQTRWIAARASHSWRCSSRPGSWPSPRRR